MNRYWQISLAVLLALALSWAITRPLQELSRHIESLGDGSLRMDQPATKCKQAQE